MKAWLAEEEATYPSPPSRWPTGREVQQAISGIEFVVKETGDGLSWMALGELSGGSDGEWTNVTVDEYLGDEAPAKPYF